MNTRTLTIVAALAIPIVLVGILARLHTKPQHDNSVKTGTLSRAPRQLPSTVPASETRQEEIAHTQDRLTKLQAMKPENWQTERLTLSPPGKAKTLQEAVAYNTEHLKKLQAMTDQEWNMEHALPAKRFPDVTPPPAAATHP